MIHFLLPYCHNEIKTLDYLTFQMKKIAILLILLCTYFSLSAQQNYTIKGKIYDSVTLEQLESVSVGIKERPRDGELSDNSGNYKLSLPAGRYTIVFRLLGYETLEKPIDIDKKNISLDIDLKPESVTLSEVEVLARKRDENVKNVQMGVEKLQIETINKVPVLFGEKDILKTIQLLPGVQMAGEGNTGFYVRGGSSDQNLILLDNAVVYNPSHLFGFFSTFNADAVEDMTIYKGSMPPQYGGRLSSTLDVGMRDGNMKKFGMSGGIGIISSRLTAEGPLQKNKSSFIVSARRTYADALGKGMGVEEVKNSTLYFYDLNAKLSYVLSDKDKLTVSAYYGKDKLGLKDITNVDWGNGIAAIKWNHIFSAKAASATSFNITDYSYNIHIDLNEKLSIASHITDYNFTQDFSLFPNNNHSIKLGYNTVYHRLAPGEVKPGDPDAYTDLNTFQHRYGWENAVYANDNIKLSDKLEIGVGLRLAASSVLGGPDFFEYDSKGYITNTKTTKKGQIEKTYWNLEPRISSAYQLTDESSIKASFARTSQGMHLLKISNMESTPTDRWVFNTNYIKPEISDQISIGYFRNFNDNNFEFSVELYYKKLKNQMDYKDGTVDIYNTENIEPYLLFGKGRAYGMELFLKKRYGRFNGWIGYTLSRSERKIDGINNNNWYVANQDRTHDFSVVGMYDLTRKWSLSATWVYTSGAPMTFPSGRYFVDNQAIYYYEGRNQYRAPAYHRLDLGATCILKKTKKYTSELAFGIYNVYGRQNPYMYGFRQNEDDYRKSESYMIYLFSVIPSITWNFKF